MAFGRPFETEPMTWLWMHGGRMFVQPNFRLPELVRNFLLNPRNAKKRADLATSP
jgi:hypothetical protein